jgi:3-dehydrotetronate 4-kinase
MGADSMLLGCIADDFTGASDLANTLAKAGMRTIQFVETPAALAGADCDAAVVSLKTRSIPAAEAVHQSLAALEALRRAGARQILFKYCSTFDSTREGNIGPVADALLDALDAPVAIVCPAFPAAGRSVYRGHLFVGDRLLNESGLENHPLNPMTDPNLVRWLGHQTRHKVGIVNQSLVAQGAGAIRAALVAAAERGERLVVCDAIDEAGLIALGHAARGMELVTGGSGIAMGLPDNFRAEGLARPANIALAYPAGRAVALAGSCSAATRAQITRHAASGQPVLRLDVPAIIEGRQGIETAAAWLAAQPAELLPLVASSDDPAEVRILQGRYGQDKAAHAIETFFGDLAVHLVANGLRRLLVAGGETSSAVVAALGVEAMRIGPEIDPGVPLLLSEGAMPMVLALKSGNFGAPDFFLKALSMIEAGTPA